MITVDELIPADVLTRGLLAGILAAMFVGELGSAGNGGQESSPVSAPGPEAGRPGLIRITPERRRDCTR